ncbi:ROK family protein [Paenibacillus sp. J2TS4]|uniref:ROK family protein n=1 Tax=Paenibacillus sp. J2TS4 TaxID=2807194 RepID=UPI001B2CEE74|nr:ROK family protein [Paenibacillus sp. J2TS4]GIP32745.1 glucokinase [Paenibacillus sp. J2TS4]
MNDLAIGVDLGGTKIHFAAMDRSGHTVVQSIVPTEAKQGAAAVLDKIMNGITDTLGQLKEKGREQDVVGIGIGSAGQIDFSSGTVAFAVDTLPGWTGTPIRDKVFERFQLPVYVDNDVNVIAIAEKNFGAARPYNSFVCIALGTGLGGAVVEAGKLVRGAYGGAGELGHISVDFNGPRCSCGNYGCIELYASGTGIARVAAEMAAANGWQTGWRADSREVIAAWNAGDVHASQVMDVVIRALSTHISSVIYTLNPQAIIIGGGVSEAGPAFFDALRKETELRTAPSMWKATTVLPAEIGTGAGVIGAAAQVWHYEIA